MTPEEKVKKYLRSHRELDNEINCNLDEKKALWELLMRLSRPYDAVPGGGGSSDTVSLTIAKIVDLEAEIDEKIDRLTDLKRNIRAIIATIHNARIRYVLTEHYVVYKPFGTIAHDLNISHRWTMNLHERGIKFLSQNFNNALDFTLDM